MSTIEWILGVPSIVLGLGGLFIFFAGMFLGGDNAWEIVDWASPMIGEWMLGEADPTPAFKALMGINFLTRIGCFMMIPGLPALFIVMIAFGR